MNGGIPPAIRGDRHVAARDGDLENALLFTERSLEPGQLLDFCDIQQCGLGGNGDSAHSCRQTDTKEKRKESLHGASLDPLPHLVNV
jgi:hypothetical protein